MAVQPLPEVPPLQPIQNTYLPYWVAMIIDGVVYDVMNLDGHAASRYLAQPTFVQVGPGDAGIGWVYDEATNTFTPPINPGQ